MEKIKYHPNLLLFNIFKTFTLLIMFFIMSAVTSYGQNPKTATINVEVHCAGYGAKYLQVICNGKEYAVMQTTTIPGDNADEYKTTFNVTWNGNDPGTFYVYVNAAYADFNGAGNTAVREVSINNGQTKTESFNLNTNPYNYSISGKVYNDGAPQSGVNVRLYSLDPASAYTTRTQIAIDVTDANGDYEFLVVPAIGLYETEADLVGFQYAPAKYSYPNLTGNMTNQNFTSIQGSVTREISGHVYKYENGAQTTTPIPNALLIVYNGNTTDINNIYTTVLTDNQGVYSFLGFEGASYTIKPMLSGYDFTTNGTGRGPTTYYTGILGASNITQNFYGELEKFSLTGAIYYNASPLQYTMVKLYNAVGGNKNGDAIDSIVTGANGIYTFSNVPGRSDYIIEPSGVGTVSASNTPLAGYNFNPAKRDVYFLIGNQTGLDFSANKNTLKISGYIVDPLKTPQGVGNIIVNISGDATQQFSTLANGYFEFYVPARSNYTITPDPTLTGYLFVNQQATSINSISIIGDTLLADKANQNFRADIQSYTISGMVLNDGVPLNGVLLTLSGTNHYGASVNQTYTTGTGTAGAYTFTVGALGTYAVTPSSVGSDFIPTDRTFSNIVRNETQTFTTTTNTKHVFGYVRRNVSNSATGINNIPLTFVSGGLSFSTVTQNYSGSDGYYSVYLPAGNAYTITPQIIPDYGYRFTYPPSTNGYYVTAALTLNENGPFNFNADTARYSITADIVNTGTELTAVRIVGGTGSDVVDITQNVANGGSYTFSNLLGLTNYTVTPTSAIYNFDPLVGEFPQLIGNKSQTFIALSAMKMYKISGKITLPGSYTSGLKNVVVTITSGAITTGTVATDDNGYYELTVNSGGTYTATPVLSGYNFLFNKSNITPVSTTDDATIVNMRGDSVVNFTSTYKTASISGKVYHLGAPLSGILFKLYMRDVGTTSWTEVTSYGAGSITSSDGSGNYSFTLLDMRHDYRVVPTPGTYTFVPSEKIFIDLLSDKPNEDFSTSANTYSLSGTIRTSSSANVANVVIKLESQSGSPTTFNSSTVTGSNGVYTFIVPAGNTYRITPLIPPDAPDMGYTFHSTSNEALYRVTVPVTSNITDLNFRADTNSYIVTGTITGTGSVVTTVTINGGSYNASQNVLASGGTYSFTVKGLIDYTIAPFSNVYNFSPVNRTLTQLVGNKSNQDFAASTTVKTYKIKGKIAQPGSTTTGLQNVVVTVTSGVTTTGVVATDATGYYELVVTAGSTYTVTPSLNGYTFTFNKSAITPASTTDDATVVNLQADSIVNFTSVYQTSTISGKVYHLGVPLNGVVFKLEARDVGASTWTLVTSYGTGSISTSNTNGEYSFTLLDMHHDYRVTPTPGTYTYVPIEKVFSDLVSDKPNEDFSTTANTHTLSGRIRTSSSADVANVVVKLETTAGPTSFTSSTVTAIDGTYSFVAPAGNSYRITPLIPPAAPDMGYTFHSTLDEAVSRLTGTVTTNIANLNFRADTNSYTISGTVSGTGTESTLITISGGSYSSSQSVLNGQTYSFTVKGLVDYTVTPVSNVYNFSPVNRVFTNLIGNKTNQNFTASTTLKTWKIAGKISKPGSTTEWLENVVVTFRSGITVVGIVATNASGYYEYNLNANSDYSVSPILSGYDFAFNRNVITPVSTTNDSLVSKLQGDSIVNFTSTYQKAYISGKVLHLGAALPDVVFTLYKKITGAPSGSYVNAATSTSNGLGEYSFNNLDQRYDYKVVPVLTGYTFVPTQKEFLDLIGSKPNEDFSTSSNTYSLSGTVATTSALGVGNVVMKLETISGPISFTSSTTTAGDGTYNFTVPAGNTYRITPLTVPDNGYNYKNTDNLSLAYRDVGPVTAAYINLNFRADTNVYTVTGTITGTALVTTRVTVTASGYSTYLDVANNELFTFNLKGLINYTITPSSAVYNYTPSLRLLPSLVGNKTNQDFAATGNLKTYKISGEITRVDAGHVGEGVGNIIVRLSNGSIVTTTTNPSNGHYEFTVPAGSTYTVTPLVPPDVTDHGYTFSPVSIPITTPVNSDLPDQDFTANLKQYTISGTVWNNGAKMNGVIIRLSDGTTNTDYITGTLNAGEYTFSNLYAHKNYTVTPLTSSGAGVGYTFVPIAKTFGDMVGDKLNEDFATNANTYKISGYVATNLSDLTSGINGVVISLSTLTGDINFSSTTTTIIDPNNSTYKGYYEFVVPAGNTYSITPLISPDQGYHYSPTVINTSTPLASNLSNQNFTALLNTYTISGKVWNNGLAMSGVLMTLKKNNIEVDAITTLADGLYSFGSLDAHADYVVTPSKAGFTFIPISRTFVDLVGDKPGEDFVTGENTKIISGFVRKVGGAPVSNITITLVTVTGSPSMTVSAVTQADGSYQFTVPSGNSYKITPSIIPDQGYNFVPSQITTSPIVDNLPNQNFTANLNIYTISGHVYSSVGGPAIQGVTVHCTGKSDVVTDAEGYYSFSVSALETHTVSPEYTGLIFSPTLMTFADIIGNKTQDFISVTERGQISADPSFLAYGDVLVNRKISKTVVITNNGVQQVIVSNLLISGDASSFTVGSTHTFPIILAPGAQITVTIDFKPVSLGAKNGNLNIYHDASTANPLQVPLSGNGVLTFVTISVPTVIDFGTVILGSGTREQTISIGNNSVFSGDNLNVSSYYFETTASIFSITTAFPIILEPGVTHPITFRLDPNELGLKRNFVHIMNSSANLPDARIEIRANVIQGDLIVIPNYIDFGRTSQTTPYKDTVVRIQNNSSSIITIQQKFVTGDTASFTISNPSPVILQPNQTDLVTVRFFPPTAGRKVGIFNILSDYSLAPQIYVPMVGIAGDQPVISADMLTIDFGNLRNGENKDTTVTITNQGSLDLVITSKTFSGLNPEIFSFVSDGNPVTLRGGQSESIILRATGKLPIGAKNAQLIFVNNDPSNPSFTINLLANVRANVLFKSTDMIVFDTVTIGYYDDSTLVLRNDGDLVAEIGRMYTDGAYANDFTISGFELPFQLNPGEEKLINIRFKPLAVGLRYARLAIEVNDPVTPIHTVILKGWGRDSRPMIDFGGGGGAEDEYEINFGKVPIFETKNKDLSIFNRSKWETLRIDSISIDYVYKQPFSFGDIQFPFYISAGNLKKLILSFNPHDKVFAYSSYLNIYYSDSAQQPNKNTYVRIRMKGTVSFPSANVELTPVLKFGKVIKDEFKTAQFKVTNLGETYLQVDSIGITGEDRSEFSISDVLFPVRLEFREETFIPVTFRPVKVGSKDAQLVLYWNDLFLNGLVEIWAEGIVSGNQTVGIKSYEIPKEFNITQNYPNPFNPSTRIEYSVPEKTFISIKVYNSIGQEVGNLVSETQSPGIYFVDFDAKRLPSGVYFYRITTEKFTSLRKMILLK